MPVIAVENLKYRYPNTESLALDGLSFTVEKGEYVAIMGESGSGKTTLLNILAALDKPTGGEVVLDGRALGTIPEREIAAFRRSQLGFVFQEFNLLDTFSVQDNIFLPLVLAGKAYPEMAARLAPIARQLGIAELLQKFPYELSGGQKQRVAIAGVIAMAPECIVLDEATAMLDPAGRREVLSAIRTLNQERGITVVLITHHMDEASMAERVVVMHEGKVAMDGTPKEVFSHVEEIHGLALLPPQTVDILYRLRACGYDLPLDALTVEECADILENWLK